MQENTGLYRLPVGCRFRPTDKELLGYFLYMKVTRMALPPQYDTLIRDCNLYGEFEPWQIWDSFKGGGALEEEEEERDMFFFTQLKKMSVNGSRISRKVGLGGGAWQGEDAAKKVPPGKSDQEGKLLGFKKRFRYENKGSVHDGEWIMHEYSLDSSLLESHHHHHHKVQVNDYVLCRIRKNNVNVEKRGSKLWRKKRKQEEEEEEEEVSSSTAAAGQEVVDDGDSQLAHMTDKFWNFDQPQL